MGSYETGGLTIEVVEGDITEAEVEAIANAANNHLWMGSGVAGAIKRKGGEQIESDAVKKGPIPVGSAIETGSGELPYRFIIHGAVMGQDLQTNPDLIARTTTSCLQLADQLDVTSLALPAFGTGVGGVDAADCARAMLQAIEDFAGAQRTLQRVVLVLFGDDTRRAFDEAAQELLER